MNAELVKRQDRWDLYGEDGSKLASSAPNPLKRLSIKNCEAIERGYDLDELVNESLRNSLIDPMEKPLFIYGYKEGFQKALEILGDKKFSEEDMIYAYREGGNDGARCESMCDGYDNEENIQESIRYGDECREEFKKSLQQTEWDVEIEMEPYVKYVSRTGNTVYPPLDVQNKLDSDGCLILKRL